MTPRNSGYLHTWPSFEQRVGPDDLQGCLFALAAAMNHISTGPSGKCKVELGSGTLHPLLVVPEVTLGLGKVSTDSTSAGRAHVEGSAAESFKYACCCSEGSTALP